MFLHHLSSDLLVLLLYVDDIILIRDSSIIIHFFIATLSYAFAMEELGDLHYILGMEVTHFFSSITLTQTKYSLNLLERHHMTSAKPYPTSIATRSKLSTYEGEPLADPSTYWKLVGALQYLTLTHPYLTYTINQLCQFMHQPNNSHLTGAKCIIHYLKGW